MTLGAGKRRILLTMGLVLAAGLGACAATAAMVIGRANLGLHLAVMATALLHLAALASLPVVLPVVLPEGAAEVEA